MKHTSIKYLGSNLKYNEMEEPSRFKARTSKLGRKVKYSGNWLEWQRMGCFLFLLGKRLSEEYKRANNEI